MAQFLKLISGYFPDPVVDYGLDPNLAENQNTIEKLRVHIDAIKPVWRNDLKTEWFDQLDATFKKLMHPLDVKEPPSGEGWVIQLVCHHYNPYPKKDQRDLGPKDKKHTDFGPYQFITDKVLTKLNEPEIRLFGVNHVALAWMSRDPQWTTEKGSQNNNLASTTVPLLDRAAPPAGGEGGDGMASGKSGNTMQQMSGMMNAMANQMKSGNNVSKNTGGGGMMGMMSGMMGASGGGYNMGMGKGSDAISKKDIDYLTRTDFLLQFVWVPPKPGDQPETPEAHAEKLKAEAGKLTEAEKTYAADTSTAKLEATIEAESLKKSQAVDSEISKALGGASGQGTTPGLPNPPGAAATPGAVPKGAGPASK